MNTNNPLSQLESFPNFPPSLNYNQKIQRKSKSEPLPHSRFTLTSYASSLTQPTIETWLQDVQDTALTTKESTPESNDPCPRQDLKRKRSPPSSLTAGEVFEIGLPLKCGLLNQHTVAMSGQGVHLPTPRSTCATTDC